MLIMPPKGGRNPEKRDLTDEDNALYALTFIARLPTAISTPTREIWFDRLDLSIIRQMVFDDQDGIVSDTRYASWTPYAAAVRRLRDRNAGTSGLQEIRRPVRRIVRAHIDPRPIDGYGVVRI